MMTRHRSDNYVPLGKPVQHPDEDQPDGGSQAGDMQGLSTEVDAAEESVEELAAEGQDFEAGILNGVEDATNHPQVPVPNRGRPR
jgi:hypothetical protein